MVISATLIPRCVQCRERIWQWKFLAVGGFPVHWRCRIGWKPFPRRAR